ncbi:hypothetical protein OLZ33_08585 [Pantoea ananatis]|jgi:hypothetical protein|uniref:hypothetical protein n=1 Tax=Pantoea ananas TaxID=553 RepID=UPI00158C8459|nr:hypothetical protein [Pantoea ananatis]MBA4819470.1 hypothetical protein [Pantoea ananatis]MCW1832057.1 hypothetical protein [Pantoea ananatis]QKV86331.1 hypothetical protein FOB88_03900 [Pantoea ananatis]
MKGQEQPFQFNFGKFEFLTLHTGQHEKFIAAAETEDDIGTVLRLHLLLEKDLEAWCACATGNGNIFKGFGENLGLDFAAKNQLAHNLGLSEELYKVIKRMNKLRNARSHQIDNSEITNSEIASLTSLISANYPSNLLPMNEFQAQINKGIIYNFISEETPNRIKFLMLFSMLKMRMCEEAKAQIH